MTKEMILEVLRQSGIKERLSDLENGPTAVCIADNGKSTVLQLKKIGDALVVTKGKVFKQRWRILLSEL